MSQIPVQKHRDGVQPQANNGGGIQPLHPDLSGRMAQEGSCKDQGQRVCVVEAHLEVQALQSTQAIYNLMVLMKLQIP